MTRVFRGVHRVHNCMPENSAAELGAIRLNAERTAFLAVQKPDAMRGRALVVFKECENRGRNRTCYHIGCGRFYTR